MLDTKPDDVRIEILAMSKRPVALIEVTGRIHMAVLLITQNS